MTESPTVGSTASTTNWWIECGANLPNGKFMRNVMVTENQVNKFRLQHNNCGVFATIYKYDSMDQKEAQIIGDFYLDLDGEELSNTISDAISSIQYMYRNYGIPTNIPRIFFSGQKGIHIVVPAEVFGITPSRDINRVFRLMAEDIRMISRHQTVDIKIYDNRRLFRLPNSKHPKTGLYKIPVSFEELRALGVEKILEMATEPRSINAEPPKLIPMAQLAYKNYLGKVALKTPKTYTGAFKALEYTPPCIAVLLDEPVPKGQRNNTAAAIASFFRQQGLNKEECEARMDEWNEKHCDPSMDKAELVNTINSVYNGAYKMGCSWMNTISTCDKGQCKLYKRRR